MSKHPWNITQLESQQSVPPTTIKKLGWGVGDGGGFKRYIRQRNNYISYNDVYFNLLWIWFKWMHLLIVAPRDLIWRYSTKNKVCGPYYMTVYFVIQVEFQWKDVIFLL